MAGSSSRAWVAALLCAAATLGCSSDGGGGDGEDTFLADAQGTWVVCEAAPEPGDVLVVNTIADHASTLSAVAFASADGTCSGHAVAYQPSSSSTFTLGGSVQATLGGRTVTAREVDVTGGGEPYFTIAYVDTGANPDALYQGDDSADPVRDGTSAALRPLALDQRPFVAGERPAVLPFLEAIQGTWISCTAEGGSWPDRREALTIAGLDVTFADWTYETVDGTCSGVETPESEFAGSATVGPLVAATLGGVAVTAARETDLVLVGGPVLYSILYVDTAATPDVIYTGDERVDPERDATAPERRPNVLQAWKPRAKVP